MQLLESRILIVPVLLVYYFAACDTFVIKTHCLLKLKIELVGVIMVIFSNRCVMLRKKVIKLLSNFI